MTVEIPLPPTSPPSLQTASHAAFRSIYHLSSLAFLHPLPPPYTLPTLPTHPNALGHVPHIAHTSTRTGALTAAQGALSSVSEGSGCISVLTGSDGLRVMMPNLHLLSRKRVPLVIHVLAEGVDEDGRTVNGMRDVVEARGSGIVLIASGPGEVEAMGVVASVVGKRCGGPVVHWFGGDGGDAVAGVGLDAEAVRAVWKRTRKAEGTVEVVDEVLKEVGTLVGKDFRAFEYHGKMDAEVVVVGLVGGADGLVKSVEESDVGGVISVRVYRPWSESSFLEALPSSVKKVIVLEQVGKEDEEGSGPLFKDVAASFRAGTWKSAERPRIVAARSTNLASLGRTHLEGLFAASAPSIDLDAPEFTSSLPEENPCSYNAVTTNAVFWDAAAANAVTSTAAAILASRRYALRVHADADAYRPAGPVTTTRLRFTTEPLGLKADLVSAAPPLDNTTEIDYVGLHDLTLAYEYNVLANTRDRAAILLEGPWRTDAEVETKLPNSFKLRAAQLELRLFALDSSRLAAELALPAGSTRLLLEVAFFVIAGPLRGNDLAHEVAARYQDLPEGLARECVARVEAELIRLDTSPAWGILEPELADLPEVASPCELVAEVEAIKGRVEKEESEVKIQRWHAAAHSLMFPEAYGTRLELEPDLHEATYVVRVTENRRLTHTDYDRNVFHIEFDTTGTELRYNIGEALGVHGHNDSVKVLKFLERYGLQPEDVVVLPFASGAGKEARVESRTVFQLFQQHLDIFGRPSKRFYEALAAHASDPVERERLLSLISAEGAADYRLRVENTTTFEDLLLEFASARPPIEQLVTMVTPIKPRHYSIASSQRMHPNSVHLLVVAVDWRTSTGELRTGQCTRYLASLRPGAAVTVSIKPSVMKLPPLHTQPVIMAGLGTGMAPFRAFIQERAVLRAQGETVGPMVLYFGSRHRADEYLYGEELEAYHAAGLVTRLGLAFSRDQPKKIYIQHRMLEDGPLIHDAMLNGQGHFYLCGPTWPVPDVKDAIVASFKDFGGIEVREASEMIETLKEKERYVLEVY